LESCKVLSRLVTALERPRLRLRASDKRSCPGQRPSKVTIAPKAKKAGGWGPLESCKVLSGLVGHLGARA